MKTPVFKKLFTSLLFVICAVMLSCKSGPFNVFKSSSPHEIYERKLINSGLAQTAMGKSWINLSDSILKNSVSIEIPYREKGYFAPENIQAAAFRFNMQRGQKLYLYHLLIQKFRNFLEIELMKQQLTALCEQRELYH